MIGGAVALAINVMKAKEIAIKTAIALETWFVVKTIVEMLGRSLVLTVVSILDCFFIVIY